MDYDELDAEIVEKNKRFGITVRRAPVNYAGVKVPVVEFAPAEKKPRRKKISKYEGETPEEKKKRLSNAAKEWYHNKVAADPSYKEKRRQDAKKWKKKNPSE